MSIKDELDPNEENKAENMSKKVLNVDEMSKEEFDSMMAKGLAQAKANESRPASDVLSDIRNNIKEWTK